MATKLKVLSLNCWGVPVPHFGSKLRPERFAAIGKQLAKAEYDIVLLQEVWSQGDYETLCSKVLTVMPYTHYFHSGVIGSGLCVFSKHPILETQNFPYTLNGYAHKVLHGDWYGRKSVGLCKVLVRGIKVYAYVTHLHADYAQCHLYHGLRATQAFELSQIIKNTSDSCDVAVVAGDFNYTADEFGCRVVVSNGNLKDAWLTQKKKVANQNEGWTVNRPENSFFNGNKGKEARIDFILYRNNAGFSIDCDTCYVTMQRAPDETFNFSDHEGVAAEFSVRKNITAMSPVRESGQVEKDLLDVASVVDRGITKVCSDRVFYLVAGFLCVVALVFSSGGATSSWKIINGAVDTFRMILVVTVAFFLWTGLVMSKIEISGLVATKKDIDNLVKSNPVT